MSSTRTPLRKGPRAEELRRKIERQVRAIERRAPEQARKARERLELALRRISPPMAQAVARVLADVGATVSLSELTDLVRSGRIREIESRFSSARIEAAFRSAAAAATRGGVPFDVTTVGSGTRIAAMSQPRAVVYLRPRNVAALVDDLQYLPASYAELRRVALGTGPNAGQAAQMVARRAGLQRWVEAGNTVSIPEIQFVGGRVSFENGRNRFTLARDQGAEAIPVAVPPEQVAGLRDAGLLVENVRPVSLDEALIQAHREGTLAGAAQIASRVDSAVLTGLLDLTNPRSVAFASEYLPTLIVGVSTSVMEAVREEVLAGFVSGIPPRDVARALRPVTPLTRQHRAAVGAFRRQLETRSIGGATPPWDRRLSAAEAAQARRIFERGGTREEIDRLVATYADRLVNRRAENIARTEIHRAHVEGQRRLWRDAVDRGYLVAFEPRRHWLPTIGDGRTRETHLAVPASNPDGVPLDGAYDTAVGPVTRPGSSGVAGFDINCRCTEFLRFEDDA